MGPNRYAVFVEYEEKTERELLNSRGLENSAYSIEPLSRFRGDYRRIIWCHWSYQVATTSNPLTFQQVPQDFDDYRRMYRTELHRQQSWQVGRVSPYIRGRVDRDREFKTLSYTSVDCEPRRLVLRPKYFLRAFSDFSIAVVRSSHNGRHSC